MINLVQCLNRLLAAGEPVAFAAIATREGSTPRTAGSRMLVRRDGGFEGTVGGGLVEARVLRAAAEVLETGAPRLLDFDLDGEMAAGADMVCGGHLRVFLERLDPGPQAGLFAELETLLAGGGRALLLSPLSGEGRTLLTPDGTALGSAPAGLLDQARGRWPGLAAPVLLEQDGRSWLVEPWASPDPLIIVGAGHVSRPTAQVAALAGFAVTVVDDRPEFASRERFPEAHALLVPPDLAHCLAGLDIGPAASLVIVTRGHLHDQTVLAQALRTPAAYIGMIGSRRKRDAVYANLMKQGFTRDDLARVHCPIGLEIKAETPEEIAVSIVAELVQERARRQGR